MCDVFQNIQDLLKNGECHEVLGLLLNDSFSRVVTPYTADLNHAWYLVGSAYFKCDDFVSALQAFKNAYRHWKEDVAAIRAIANCYSELKNPKMAKYYFSKAKIIGGKGYKDLDVLTYNLGNAFFDMNKFDLAIIEYKKVRKSDIKTYRLAQKNIKQSKNILSSKKRLK